MFVKPVEGRLVRDPRTFAPVPPQGREVPEISFWLRRVRDGDVVEASPAPEAAAAAATPHSD